VDAKSAQPQALDFYPQLDWALGLLDDPLQLAAVRPEPAWQIRRQVGVPETGRREHKGSERRGELHKIAEDFELAK
jgi:hypothetical protein